jgi:hypothetical protein
MVQIYVLAWTLCSLSLLMIQATSSLTYRESMFFSPSFGMMFNANKTVDLATKI